MTPEERLIEIESKISHQEFLIEKLNEALIHQQQTVDRLEGTLNGLIKRLGNLSNEPEIGPGNEKPPHY